MKAFINGKIIKEDAVLDDYFLIVKDGIIFDIERMAHFNPDQYKDIIDLKGNYLAPGFVDIHIHGSGGADVMDATPDALKTIGQAIAKTGTTSFLATTMTMEQSAIYQALDNIRQHISSECTGSKILGAHLEGPFINKAFKGAQNGDFVIKPSYGFIEPYLDVIKIVTLAPEEDDNFQFINKMKEHDDIVLSIGHSASDFETALKAYDHGVRHITHCFNAMTPLHHRKPGIVGAAFTEDFTTELIADGIHSHEGFFKTFINIKGHDKVILVTDSMRAGTLDEGGYDLGGQKVIVKDGSARLTDGTLAGSVLKMNHAVKNIMANTEEAIRNIVKMASLNPAQLIGVDDKLGSIEIGKCADLIIIDHQVNIFSTFVDGKCIYNKEDN